MHTQVKVGTRATHPCTRYTLHRNETKFPPNAHIWMGKRYSRGQEKEASTQTLAAVYVNVPTRPVRACTRVALHTSVSVCIRGAADLYSAWPQFYLLHVFVANRAHTIYVKPRCWHVHATFPFQNRFWRRAPRRLSQRRRRSSGQGRLYSNQCHTSRFIFFFYFHCASYYLLSFISFVSYRNFRRPLWIIRFRLS